MLRQEVGDEKPKLERSERRWIRLTDAYRQEVFNVLLAQLLQERGVITAPESILKATPERARRMPDLIVNFYGLRTMIEGEVDDRPDAETKALDAARRRVVEGIAHIGLAVVYPSDLRGCPFPDLKQQLADTELRIALVTEAEDSGYVGGTVDDLERALRGAFDRLVEEDVVAKAVAELDAAIERFAGILMSKPGNAGRVAMALDLRDQPSPDHPRERFNPATSPRQEVEQVMAAARIGGLILTNAMIFHGVLSDRDERVPRLAPILDGNDISERLRDHWKTIMMEINYHPIFHIARALLDEINVGPEVLHGLRGLGQTALSIVSKRAALRHDLMGRVYHRLLSEPKYLATFYTSIPAADLLLKLALRPESWSVAWQDLKAVEGFRIADLACGTGTLLMAAADTVMDNYLAASAAQGQPVNLDGLHKALAEEVLYGYDVLVSALHLTASTLALKSPDVVFDSMNLFSLPLGGPDMRLGSIDFLRSDQVGINLMLFGGASATRRVKGKGDEDAIARPPRMDLCVMNPPFTRSVGGNLLFGSSKPDERAEMQKELKKLVKQKGALASITAGLGSVFVAVADRYIKPGGRIALVLPKAVLSGVAWDRTRDLLRGKYRLEYIVASHDPTRWNFSESTSLSEVLLVAEKLDNGTESRRASRPVVGVNLWKNPTTSFDALAVANQLLKAAPPDIEKGQGAVHLGLGDTKFGEAVSIPWNDLKEQYLWLLPCAFAQSDLIRAAYRLLQNRLWIPGSKVLSPIPLSPLSSLGSLGPDARDMHDAFSVTETKTAFAAFWGHKTADVCSLAQTPNRYLSPLPTAKEGRHLRKAEDLWPHAGDLLLAERLRLNTQRTTAVRVSKPVLSNVWWPLSLADMRNKEQIGKALTLWLNSTLGLLLLLAHREETEGAWVKFKKPVLGRLPVLDVRLLSAGQRRQLASAYDAVAGETLQPFPHMASDPVRAAMDEAVAQVLDLPDFSILRELLAQEPIICLKRL